MRGIISSLGNQHLRRLLEEIFADAVLVALYKRAPAAKSIHHACLGGLIEHVLSLCALCRMTAAHYQGVDVDLLLASAILHDIGKTEELAYERSFSYTAAGQLVGHIVMGVQLVSEKIARRSRFPAEAEAAAGTHHPEPSRFAGIRIAQSAPVSGSVAFHHLDNLDSKFEAMRAAIERDGQTGQRVHRLDFGTGTRGVEEGAVSAPGCGAGFIAHAGSSACCTAGVGDETGSTTGCRNRSFFNTTRSPAPKSSLQLVVRCLSRSIAARIASNFESRLSR